MGCFTGSNKLPSALFAALITAMFMSTVMMTGPGNDAAAQTAQPETKPTATLNTADGGFRVLGYREIEQGQSHGQVLEALKKSTRQCRQDLTGASHDASLFVIKSCFEPKVYLSFCDDKLYWASTVVKGDFAAFIGMLRIFTRSGLAGDFKVSDAIVKPQVRRDNKVVQDYELSLVMSGTKYDVTLTMFADGQPVKGVASDYRLDYQAHVDADKCS